MPHGIIMTIIIGFLVGIVAKLITPGREPFGFFITALVGIAGSFLGTYIGRAIGHYDANQSAGFLMSLLGACILLGLYHLLTRSSGRV